MQNTVIFGILLTILNSRRTSREYLSEKYEISERTVVRYVSVLVGSGVPIISARGKNGGYFIADDYKLNYTYFNNEEKNRMINCINESNKLFSDSLNDIILDKIIHMKKNAEDERYLIKSDTLIIDIGTWNKPQFYRSKIESINKGIHKKCSIFMKYVDKYDFATERLFDPYSLVLKEGVWYTYGWCHTRKDFRLFKLTRIRSMTITNDEFIVKPNDVYSKLNGNFDDSLPIELVIEFSSTILSEIQEWLGFDSISERGTKYIAKANLFSGNFLLTKLLSFGSSIKILSPNFIKEELLVECKRIIDNH